MPKEKVEVTAYSGYRGEEIPRVFKWRGTRVEVAEILSRWTAEGVRDRDRKREFRLIGRDGITYSLTYDEETQEWFRETKKEDV